ncbi:MAG: hypothetical protein V4620_08230 [Bacteroidota bacterium]
MTKKLIIKNIGPIKNIDINISKVNIFMGEQSSGKSTIAKILSFCSWIEKDISFHQSFEKYTENNYYFVERLETFHKMKGYFNYDSEIIYVGEAISIIYKNELISIEWLETRFNYKKCKISYIPSERSTVILPEMEKLELPNNYLKSFLFDWFDTRKNYTVQNKFPILDIGIAFYYSEDNKESHISNEKYDILLSQASSGLQSITPLLTMVHSLVDNINKQDKNSSYELDEVKAKVTQLIISEFVIKKYFGQDFTGDMRKNKIQELNKKISENDENVMALFQDYKNIRNNLFRTHRTNLIIEEPEQNLFPSTQKQLIYKLLEYLVSDLDHSLTITTHSPYVLYAINNCILSYIVKEKISGKIKDKINCSNSSINPIEIKIYEIKDGTLNCIQQQNGLIGENFFDNQMKQVMDDFYLMINYL